MGNTSQGFRSLLRPDAANGFNAMGWDEERGSGQAPQKSAWGQSHGCQFGMFFGWSSPLDLEVVLSPILNFTSLQNDFTLLNEQFIESISE